MFSYRRLLVVAIATVGIIIPATSAARTNAAPRQVAVRHGHVCHKLFTVKMGIRAARAIWSGTRTVPRHDLRVAGYIERCQRNPRARGIMRAIDHGFREAHDARVAVQAYVTRFDGWAIPAYIVQCESGGKNEPIGADGNPTTASGYYQMEDPTWQSWAASAGLHGYPSSAYLASRTDQGLAAGWGYDNSGKGPWVCG